MFSIRYFGVFIYKIRFPLLRAAGNTGSHCSSTWLCLCGVGSSPCWRHFSPACPGRHCQAEPHRHSSRCCTTAPLQPLLCRSVLGLPGETGKALRCCWQLGSCKWGWAQVGTVNSSFLHLPTSAALSAAPTAPAHTFSGWFQESLHLCPQAQSLLNQISEASSSLSKAPKASLAAPWQQVVAERP